MPNEIVALATQAAEAALKADREGRKLGRDDRGTGSLKIGDYLKKARDYEKLTQRQLGERTGLHPTTIGKIETGERGMSLSVFAKIAWSLNGPAADEFVWDVIGYYGS